MYSIFYAGKLLFATPSIKTVAEILSLKNIDVITRITKKGKVCQVPYKNKLAYIYSNRLP